MGYRYIGLMSGTSIDGIDAAVIEITDGAPRLIAALCFEVPTDLKDRLRTLITQASNVDLDEFGTLDSALGDCFADAARAVLKESGLAAGDIRAIGSHGQTVRHGPIGDHPFTVQIADPNRIAERTGITTVADFRRRDVAAGGEGAPLAPGLHAAVFAGDVCRAVINIGGLANITVLDPKSPVRGFDSGPGNTLMDTWIFDTRGIPFDIAGRWAATGKVDEPFLKALLADDYFRQAPPKSTGREHFNADWVHTALGKLDHAPDRADVQRTLLELTGRSIADDVKRHAPNTTGVYVCGGGAHNQLLMSRLAELLAPVSVETTDVFGIAPDWVEAAAFAWLAHCTLEGIAGNLPTVTGASRPVVLGAAYPA